MDQSWQRLAGGVAGRVPASIAWGRQGPTSSTPRTWAAYPPSAPLQGLYLFLNIRVLVVAGVTRASRGGSGSCAKARRVP